MNLQLAALRERRHMTQTELALEVGATLRKVSAWERGETPIRLEDAALIADVLGCTLDELANPHAERAFPSLTPAERELIDAYNDTDARGRENIIETARREKRLAGTPEAVLREAR